MNSNSNSQQSKAEPKWQAITSVVLGIISVLAAVNIVTANFPTWSALWEAWDTPMISPIFIGPIFGGLLFATVGFILGIMGLKYTKRKLAIAGIILSVIGFVAFVHLHFMAARIGYE